MTEQKVEQTEQDRLERVRGLLSGTIAPEGAGARVQSAHGNVLMGAFLHGADRLRQGHEPTDLERLMLDAVGSVLPEEEMRAWGGVYREVADSDATMAMVPQAFANRPVGEGYAIADLRNDLPDIIAEAMAAGNTQIRDPRRPDRDTDDPAFLTAMRTARFAVSAFAVGGEAAGTAAENGGAAEDGGADGPEAGAAATFRAKLEAEKFYVRRAVGDRWGTSDEIFWTASVGTGVGAGGTFRSETFGNVDKGDERAFMSSNKVLFDGTTSGDYLGAQVICWEQDDVNADWWAALQKALTDAMDKINFLLDFDNFVGFFPTWVGIATAAATFIAQFLQYFQNKSDISCQRAIGMGRHELAILSRVGRTVWRFDGDGDHDLHVKWSGATIPFAEGFLEHSIRSGTDGTWRTGIPLTYKTITMPALAVHEGRLYICFLRPSDQGVMWASTDAAGNWTQPAQVGGDHAWYAPALTSANGKLHYAVTGKDGRVYTRTYTPAGGWSASHIMSGRSKFSPALATYENQAWLVAYGLDENLYHARHNGTWGGWVEDNLDWKLDTHVALAPRDRRLWRIATNREGRINTSINGGGSWAGEPMPAAHWRASHAPALAGNGSTMTLVMRSPDATLWTAEYDGNWAGAQKIAGITATETPAAVYFGGNLHVIYRRIAS
ncbi:hypothetical protein ACIRD3_31975 [Kitasatospora sp. NPDC093550]|uniref:hypothetical protein n=1 Tax=Kitasatospora sp. NPDC093550 TaxID=3364089 RepID=UPI00381D9793